MIEAPLGNILLGPVKNAANFYKSAALAAPKAAYSATSKGLASAGSKVAGSIPGVSKATAAKVGAAVGGKAGVAAAGGIAAVGAAAAIYAGYKLYKNYISKAGVACKNNPNRRRCELEYQLRGKKAQLQAILNGHHHCQSHTCYQALDNKANQLKREMDTLNLKISKTPNSAPKPERRNDEVSKEESEES